MNFLRDQQLSQAASDLVQFDADSIRHIATAQHRVSPDIWLVDPDAYERAGRIFRDSDSPRMLAYSTKDHVLYATDGCNSCARRAHARIESLPPSELKEFANENGLRLELLQKLIALIAEKPTAR